MARQSRRVLHDFHVIDCSRDGLRWRMHRLTRDFGRRAEFGDPAEADVAFVRGCGAFARSIDLAAGFRVYVPDRTHLDAAVGRAPSMLANDPEALGSLLDRIGTARQSLGEYASARQLLEQALASALTNLGEDHPSVATSRFNLVRVCDAEGDLAEARRMYEQTLASELRSLGSENPSLAYTRASLADVLWRAGEKAAARREAREARRVVTDQPEGAAYRVQVEQIVARILEDC